MPLIWLKSQILFRKSESLERAKPLDRQTGLIRLGKSAERRNAMQRVAARSRIAMTREVIDLVSRCFDSHAAD
jgi:hypothetical protein